MRPALMGVMLALASCANTPTPAPPPAAPVLFNSKPVTKVVVVEKPANCKPVSKALVKTEPKAEGAVADVYQVAKDRGDQVDRLNEKITKLDDALDTGCITVKP